MNISNVVWLLSLYKVADEKARNMVKAWPMKLTAPRCLVLTIAQLKSLATKRISALLGISL